jgi:nicotinamidase-related amidase
VIDPAHTAVVTLELQRGVVGDRARFPALRDAVREAGMVANTARLLAAARAAGAAVVHCTTALPRGRIGAYDHVPMLRRLGRDPDYLRVGSPDVELVAELGARPGDLESSRDHGMAPFWGTTLDAQLRTADTRTLLATGVSLNVGIPGLVIGAIDRGYEVVVVTDCVAGVPAAYGRSVLEHSLGQLAALVRADDLIAVWSLTV